MRPEKKQLVQDIKALLEASTSLFLISYKGLTAAQFADLRGQLAEKGSECHVIPNRLFVKAAEEAGLSDLAAFKIADDNAFVSGGEDAVGVAKVLKDFTKEHDVVAVRMGVIDGKLCDATSALKLADLPSREVLLAMLLGVLQAPSSQLVRVLHAKLASVVYVLNAYLNKKEQAA